MDGAGATVFKALGMALTGVGTGGKMATGIGSTSGQRIWIGWPLVFLNGAVSIHRLGRSAANSPTGDVYSGFWKGDHDAPA